MKPRALQRFRKNYRTLKPIILIGLGLATPSTPQLERHIRQSAAQSANVAFVKHAWDQMRARHVNQAMVMEVLRKGRMLRPPEPDIRFSGLKCRMEHFVAGMNVAVVVAVEYPAPDLTVVTVIDIRKG